jgi:beta-phosphoglucomutase-like phosphatase (HAD superfamily)
MRLNRVLETPRAVIFDMDGLLLDSESIYGRVWQQAAVELGYPTEESDYLRYVGRRAEDCADDLLTCYGADFPLSRFWERQIELYEIHRNDFGIPVKSGAEELLTYLQSCRIPTAIATSSQREQALSSLGEIADRVDFIVTGDEVSKGKPDPEIFLLAARRLSTPARACLVLEDAEAGARAACAACMPVIMVPDLNPPSEETADSATALCSSLLEVRALLAHIQQSCDSTNKPVKNEVSLL